MGVDCGGPLVDATWIVRREPAASPPQSTPMSNPTNQVFTFDGWYSPSENLNETEWTLVVTASDLKPGAVPNPASAGWGWSRTVVKKEVIYSVTPSYLVVTATGTRPHPGGLRFCDGDIALQGTDHLVPQIALTSKLTWTAFRGPTGGPKAHPRIGEPVQLARQR